MLAPTQVQAVRRRNDTQPATEIQQNRLPPRLGWLSGADVAGRYCPAMTSAATSLTTPASGLLVARRR
jgi:hypothetical protein